MHGMDQSEIADYLVRVESAIGQTNKTVDFETFNRALVSEVEAIVATLDARIRAEGVNYPTPNESRATARALLWASWVSWLWTAKSERPNPDANAQRVRPIVEQLLEEFIAAGRLVGQKGGRPERVGQN